MTCRTCGLKGEGDERVLNYFKVNVLSDGSGVQFHSTTFVQWAAREILRRAQPVTLLAPQGALVDADMGAYYTWLNQMRLTGADESSFLVWFENHTEALVISPSSPRGVQSNDGVDLSQLLDQVLAGSR